MLYLTNSHHTLALYPDVLDRREHLVTTASAYTSMYILSEIFFISKGLFPHMRNDHTEEKTVTMTVSIVVNVAPGQFE